MNLNGDSRLSSEVEVGQREMEERQRRLDDVQRPRYRVFDRGDLLRAKMPRNYVMVEVPRGDTEVIELGDGRMELNTRYREMEWAPTYCRVVNKTDLPLRMKFKDQRFDMEWETDVEVSVGDMVLCRYLAITTALGLGDVKGENRSVMDREGRLYAMVNYRDLVCRFRKIALIIDGMNYYDSWHEVSEGVRMYNFGMPMGEGKSLVEDEDVEIWPLNGYVILSPVESEDMKLFEWKSPKEAKESALYARVEAVGSRIRGYSQRYAPDFGQLRRGDFVALQKGGHLQLQERGNEVLGRRMFRCPVRHVLCKFERGGSPIDGEGLDLFSPYYGINDSI